MIPRKTVFVVRNTSDATRKKNTTVLHIPIEYLVFPCVSLAYTVNSIGCISFEFCAFKNGPKAVRSLRHVTFCGKGLGDNR